MTNPYIKNDAQYGVRAAAAFVLAKNIASADKACQRRADEENERHATALQRIYANFQFAASEALRTYNSTLDATQGDDDEMDDDD